MKGTARMGAGFEDMTYPHTAAILPMRQPRREWWGRHLTEQQYREMAIEIERVKAQVASHLSECAQLNKAVQGKLDDLKEDMRWVLRGGVVGLISLVAYLFVQVWPPHHAQAQTVVPEISAPAR